MNKRGWDFYLFRACLQDLSPVFLSTGTRFKRVIPRAKYCQYFTSLHASFHRNPYARTVSTASWSVSVSRSRARGRANLLVFHARAVTTLTWTLKREGTQRR